MGCSEENNDTLIERIAQGILKTLGAVIGVGLILGWTFSPLILAIATRTWWVGLFMILTLAVVITDK